MNRKIKKRFATVSFFGGNSNAGSSICRRLQLNSKVLICLHDLNADELFCNFQANKIIEHRRKYERKREEKEIKEKQDRIKKAREEHARAQRVSCWEEFHRFSRSERIQKLYDTDECLIHCFATGRGSTTGWRRILPR